MFKMLKAVIGVIWTGGHVSVPNEIRCPYCDHVNGDFPGGLYSNERRPLVSISGKVICRNCKRGLDHHECEACQQGLDTSEVSVDG